jgi:hypothetical protein
MTADEIRTELRVLENAKESTPDSSIRKVIEHRILELKRKLKEKQP